MGGIVGAGPFSHGSDTGPVSTNTNTQTTNTTNVDSRSVADNRNYANTTTNTLASGNIGSTLSDIGNTETNSRNVTTTNITQSDSGAIAAGAAIASAALTGNAGTVASVLDLTKVLFQQSQKSLDANVQLTGQLASGANQAYSDATAQATGNKSLILVAIAVVGIAAVFAFKHK